MSLRVLIADSNVDAAESLALLLQWGGNRVVTAETGPDALALASAIHPEVAILALHQSHVGGLDVARSLSSGATCTPPRLMIALTGDGRESTREASRAAGFDLHVMKPADPARVQGFVQIPANGKTGQAP